MKRLLLALFLATGIAQLANAQCAQCTPVNCSSTKPTGGLCNNLPDDTAGKTYDNVISFYMPKKLTDPTTLSQCGGCSSVDLRQIDIVGIQGLPPGLSYTASQGGSYNVAGGDSLGCVRFCGIPVAPGTYYVTVNLLADVTANGTPIGSVQANDQPQSYRDTMVIYPGQGACPTSFDLGAGGCVTQACDSVHVDLNATLTNSNCSNLISYDWSYGNGGTSHSKTPGGVTYNTPDTFPLTLVTTYYTYRVKSVTVTVTGGYTGDIEELTGASKPDPYIRINSLAFSNRGSSSDQNSNTYNNLNLVIPDASCGSPLEIQVWDEDTGPPQGTNPLGSQDDHINDHYVTPGVPNQVVSLLGNSSVAVTFDTVATSSVTETVNIIVNPHPPVPVLVVGSDSICNGDSTTVSIAQSLTGYNYEWWLNDTTQLLTADSAIWAKKSGTYKVKITDLATGCSEWSGYANLAVGTPPPSNINVLFNQANMQCFVSPFPATGFAVDWFYNGNLVTGQHGKFLSYLGNGDYSAILYNVDFPFCRTESAVNNVFVSGINEAAASPIYDMTVAPNPNKGKFNLHFALDSREDIRMTVTNVMGQNVFERKLSGFTGDFNEELDLTGLSKGVYVLNLETAGSKMNKLVVVQ
ncbi:MAG: T9SS type A sorting domain-containing protein [Chitinophagales bacterium]